MAETSSDGAAAAAAAAKDEARKEFDEAVYAATRSAFEETLASGLPVFYLEGSGASPVETFLGDLDPTDQR